jgi:hypothetical protein
MKDKQEGFFYLSSDSLIANAIEKSERDAKRGKRKAALRDLSDKSREERKIAAQYGAAASIVGAGETIGFIADMSPSLAARHLAEVAAFVGFDFPKLYVRQASREAIRRMVQAAEALGQPVYSPDSIAPGHPHQISPRAAMAREGGDIVAREKLAELFGPSWYDVIEAAMVK